MAALGLDCLGKLQPLGPGERGEAFFEARSIWPFPEHLRDFCEALHVLEALVRVPLRGRAGG